MFLPISVAALLGGAIASPESSRAIEQRQDRSPFVRTGNWSTLKCDSDGYDYGYNLDWTPAEKWGRMDCKSAWDDVITEWKTEYQSINQSYARFSPVVMSRFGRTLGAECGSELWTSRSACPATVSCSDHAGGTLPAGAEVANALGRVHETFHSYARAIPDITSEIINSYQNFSQNLNRSDFLRHPTIRTSTIGVAVLAAAASSFNVSLHDRPYFTHHPPSVLRTSFTTLAQSLSHGINTTSPTVSGLYALQDAWESAVETAALHLFRGSDASIDKLTSLIADGRMARGAAADPRGFFASAPERDALWDQADVNVGKVFHMVVMQAMWEGAGAGVVVVPGKGEGCEDPTGKERRPEGVGEEAAEKGAEEAVANGKGKERWDVYPCNMVEGSVPVPATGAKGFSGGLSGTMLCAGFVMLSLVLW